jgi:hypothetical protein
MDCIKSGQQITLTLAGGAAAPAITWIGFIGPMIG